MDYNELKSPIAKAILMQEMASKIKAPYIVVRDDKRPISPDVDPLRDPHCRATTGVYYVEFSPVGVNGFTHERNKFLVLADVLTEAVAHTGSIRCASYNSIRHNSESSSWMKWLLDMTNLSQLHFDLAVQNMGTMIPFTIDMKKLVAWSGQNFTPNSVRYVNDLRNKVAVEKNRMLNRKANPKRRKSK